MRAIARKLRKCPVSHPAIMRSALWAKRFACAIRSIGSSSRGRRALYAAGRHRIRIISHLPNLVHLDTESVTSSPSQFVGSTTASFIARVMRPRGGPRSTLILFQSRSGSGSTRGSMAMDSRQQAKASRRRSLQRQRTCQFKIERVRTTMRPPMWRAPVPRTPTHLQRMTSFRQIEANRVMPSGVRIRRPKNDRNENAGAVIGIWRAPTADPDMTRRNDEKRDLVHETVSSPSLSTSTKPMSNRRPGGAGT